MPILIENMQQKIEVNDNIFSMINKSIETVIEYEKFPMDYEVSILLVDNSKIRELNKEYRNKDADTDVLSFPIVDMKNGKIQSMVGDVNNNQVLLGDIVVSLEKAKSQSVDYEHSFEREICFLVIHGLFHLLGYDHIIKEDEDIMTLKQEEILETMKLLR